MDDDVKPFVLPELNADEPDSKQRKAPRFPFWIGIAAVAVIAVVAGAGYLYHSRPAANSRIEPAKEEKSKAVEVTKANRAVRSLTETVSIDFSSGHSLKPETPLTQERRFTLSGLSPSSWANLKYRESITFRVPGPGRILLEASWQRPVVLALILNGPTGISHAQKDGKAPVRVSYRITPQEFGQGSSWEAVVANFTGEGPVDGALKVTYSGETSGQTAPVTLAPAPDISRLEGEINRALRKSSIMGVTVEIGDDRNATVKGTVPSPEEKERALEIVRGFKSIKSLKDVIFVVRS